MSKLPLTLFTIFVAIFFSACSGRQYYSPEDLNYFHDKEVIHSLAYIKTLNANGATLEDNHILIKDGIAKTQLPKGYTFLNYSDNTLIAKNTNQEILFAGTNTTFDMQRDAIAVSKEDNLLALVFSDNSLAIYDTDAKQFKFKEYQQHSYLNDIRVASPIILKNIILFATLDGKVIVVDKKSLKNVRTINIDPDNQIKNIILLKAIGDTLIAASPNKLITINNGNFSSKEFFIQNYFVSEDGFIYIAKLDGTIVKFDLDLNEIGSKKFKFAKFLSMSVDKNQNVYALELGGYLVRINKDFEKFHVYRFPLQDDEKMFAMNDKIYFDNKILYLDKNSSK